MQFTIHPLNYKVTSSAKTYHELTTEFLGDSNYYFSDSPVGRRAFGPIPKPEVYLRQTSTLKNAVEEIVGDDPIIVKINPNGEGELKLHLPVPSGFSLTLRELLFSEDPEIGTLYFNGEGPLAFTYSNKIGTLAHPIKTMNGPLLFSVPHLLEARIYLTSNSALGALELFLPKVEVQPISLDRFFYSKQIEFKRHSDGSYRALLDQSSERLRAILPPPGNWKLYLQNHVGEVNLASEFGIISVNQPRGENYREDWIYDRETIELICLPEGNFRGDYIYLKIYFDFSEELIRLKDELKREREEISKLKTHLRRAEEQLIRLL